MNDNMSLVKILNPKLLPVVIHWKDLLFVMSRLVTNIIVLAAVLLLLAQPLLLSLKLEGGDTPTCSLKTKNNSCICPIIQICSQID